VDDLDKRVSRAIRHFWETREAQHKKQSSEAGKRNQGFRGAVTGGAQLDGFITLVSELLAESGIPNATIHKKRTTLPGYYRPSKDWDLVVVVGEHLLATIEFKSQVGPSFGNNFNNRVEEALGNATDLWTAYREGAFEPSQQPWLGYVMLLEDAPNSISPVRVSEPHFRVFDIFRSASYAKRYELFCQRLVRERLYDAACFMMSDRVGGLRGKYKEPVEELNFRNFAVSLMGRASAFAHYT
jgi:hypothetical protein